MNSTRRVRLSHHMAAILLMLDGAPGVNHPAENFVRTALASLASAGLVDIVGGMVLITFKGSKEVGRAGNVRYPARFQCRNDAESV